MAASMELEFDVDKLRSTREKCEELTKALEERQKGLQSSLETLKKGWNTPAGKKFFETKDNDWSEQVNHYIDIAKAVISLLDCAIKEYAEIEAKAQQLKFDP